MVETRPGGLGQGRAVRISNRLLPLRLPLAKVMPDARLDDGIGEFRRQSEFRCQLAGEFPGRRIVRVKWHVHALQRGEIFKRSQVGRSFG